MSKHILLYGLLGTLLCCAANAVLLSTLPGTLFFLAEGGMFAAVLLYALGASGIRISIQPAVEFVVLAQVIWLGLMFSMEYGSFVVMKLFYSPIESVPFEDLLKFAITDIGLLCFLCLCHIYCGFQRPWRYIVLSGLLFQVAVTLVFSITAIVIADVSSELWSLLLSYAPKATYSRIDEQQRVLIAPTILMWQLSLTVLLARIYRRSTIATQQITPLLLPVLTGINRSAMYRIFAAACISFSLGVTGMISYRLLYSHTVWQVYKMSGLRSDYQRIDHQSARLLNPLRSSIVRNAVVKAFHRIASKPESRILQESRFEIGNQKKHIWEHIHAGREWQITNIEEYRFIQQHSKPITGIFVEFPGTGISSSYPEYVVLTVDSQTLELIDWFAY